jgi:hypothetical protein
VENERGGEICVRMLREERKTEMKKGEGGGECSGVISDLLFFQKKKKKERVDAGWTLGSRIARLKATLLCQTCGPLNRHAVCICSIAHGLISHVSYSYSVLPVPPMCNIF